MKISSSGFSVYLGSISKDDAEAIESNGNDYEIASSMPSIPHPYKREDILAFIDFANYKYLNRDEYHLAVRLDNGTLIGMCALANIDTLNRKAELGYWLGRKYWGKGYAKQAIRLIMHLGFEELELNKIYAKVLTNNERSIGLLNSLKFQKEGLNREDVLHMGRFVDDFTFSMLKKDYTCSENVTLTE
jgi:RimJ/RimL family protein N-acetyltransferase